MAESDAADDPPLHAYFPEALAYADEAAIDWGALAAEIGRVRSEFVLPTTPDGREEPWLDKLALSKAVERHVRDGGRIDIEHVLDERPPIRKTDGYAARVPTHGGYGMPRGPLDDLDSPQPTAIGFCPWCGTNARGTCAVLGAFDCPECDHVWYDARVGEPSYSFEDFFSDADSRLE